MKQENQLCTLEQSKRLKELGITQESQFYWLPKWKASDGELLFIGQKCDKGFYHCIDGVLDTFDHPSPYSAYTVAELGVMLPAVINTVMVIASFGWRSSNDENFRIFNTQAEAYADVVIYYLENNRTTASDCNERLNQA